MQAYLTRKNSMITYEQALEIVLSTASRAGTERVPFGDALNRILAEDIYSDVDMPPFDKAAMDGYACRREDLEMELEVLEVVAAGQIPSLPVGAGQCTKIMTGAMIPRGADTVIMVEQTTESGRNRIRFTGKKTAANIARKAEDVRQGDMVWQKGMPVLPQHIAILAATGCVNPLVSKKVRVGILSTGDELVEPDQQPGPGQIRNSNGFQLAAQVLAAHCSPNYMGIVPDDERATELAISRALAENDVVILTGGVSMGEFDFVPRIMQRSNVEILFRKVAVKPGRPTVFGRAGEKVIFGLPGNPVSSFINFETFVKPLLYAKMGRDYRPVIIKMLLGVDFRRKKADRLEFLPVRFNRAMEVEPVTYHGSAHIHAMCLADGIMSIRQGEYELKKGSLADVRPV
jgi:molybdopterin molybdotransferase